MTEYSGASRVEMNSSRFSTHASGLRRGTSGGLPAFASSSGRCAQLVRNFARPRAGCRLRPVPRLDRFSTVPPEDRPCAWASPNCDCHIFLETLLNEARFSSCAENARLHCAPPRFRTIRGSSSRALLLRERPQSRFGAQRKISELSRVVDCSGQPFAAWSGRVGCERSSKRAALSRQIMELGLGPFVVGWAAKTEFRGRSISARR